MATFQKTKRPAPLPKSTVAYRGTSRVWMSLQGIFQVFTIGRRGVCGETTAEKKQ
jgi:hypothetical protein